MKKITHTIILIILSFSFQTFAQVSESWVSLFNSEEANSEEPTDLVVDSEGNIYITGWVFGTTESYDFVTLKYNASGELQWSQYYDGPLHSSDQAEAIAVDNTGNIYVIGDSQTQTYGDITIIKYNSDGDQLWLEYYDDNSTDGGYDIEIGENGMIYAVGYSNSQMITLQYNPDGELQWVATYNGAEEGLDIGTKLVLDASSNVYITGYTKGVGGLGTNRDITTIKYSAEGVQQWAAIYNGPGNASDEGYEIALDELNNVYVLGYSNAEESHIQFATIKYNQDGEEVWVNRYYNPETLTGSPNALAVFDSENIYVTGSNGLGLCVVKINNAGDTVWTRNYNSGHADQAGTDIITDMDGNIYVTGWVSDGGSMWTRDYGTLKYSPDGVLLWDIWYQGLGENRDDALNICLNNENNVIITGQTDAGATSYDIGTIKYIQSSDAIEEQWGTNPDFIIYPNPTKDKVKVKRQKAKGESALVEIYDLHGRLFHKKQVPAGTNEIEIDVSHLPGGVYCCKVSTKNKSAMKKPIIQK